MAVRVVIDHSTSMNHAISGKSRIQHAAQAAMMLHLAFVELSVEHGISVMPQQVQLADLASGEAGKALIAGVVPAKTGYEDLAVAVRTRADELLALDVDIRLLFVLHDGYPNDADRAKALCQSLRGTVEVIGVLLDPEEDTQTAMTGLFGADRLVACASRVLPKKLAAMLEAIRGI
jgi:nitric oxide reductase activation protein